MNKKPQQFYRIIQQTQKGCYAHKDLFKGSRFAVVLFPLFIFLFSASNAFGSTCNTYGSTTYCSDGTTYNTYGNTTYGSDGTTYNTYGGTTYVNGSNGYSGTANTYGNTTYYNGTGGDSWTANTYGNTTYINGNNGTSGTVNTYGGTSYGDGNVFNTCPPNSFYDSSTGKCSCSYGYGVNFSKTSCVYTGTTYTAPTYQGTIYSNTSTYAPAQKTCPLNSHVSATDTTMCQCNVGYQPNTANNGCILVTVKSNTQVCQDSFGINVDWDGTKAANGNLNCNCKSSYVWNSERTACILSPIIPVPTVPVAPVISTPIPPQTEIRIITPSAKKEIKTSNAIRVKNKETTTVISDSVIEKIPWYKKIFSWFM